MAEKSPAVAFLGFAWRTTLLHLATYLVVGSISYFLVAQPYWTGPEALPGLRDPMSDHVQQWMWPAQILRAILHAAVLYPLLGALFALGRWGGAMISALLLVLGSIAGINGLIEGLVFTTTVDLRLFFAHLPEVVLQTLAFGYLLLWWEKKVRARRAAAEPEAQ